MQSFAVYGIEALTDDAHASDWTAYHTPESVRRAELPEGHLERSRLLDKPSDPNPMLTALMDEALTQIMLVSDGAVMALTARLTGSRKDSTPTSYLAAIIDNLDRRYEKCRTHRKRLELIKEAQATSVRLRYAPQSICQGTDEWRQAIANDERSTATIAEVYSVNPSTVTRIKKAAGTNRPHGGKR